MRTTENIAKHIIIALTAKGPLRDGWKLVSDDEKADLIKEIAGMVDDEESDCTDFAHPAWWRGNDKGVWSAADRIRQVLDGKDDGHGVIASVELEQVRRDILELRRERDAWMSNADQLKSVKTHNELVIRELGVIKSNLSRLLS